MTILKATCLTIATASVLALAPAAYANQYGSTYNTPGTATHSSTHGVVLSTDRNPLGVIFRSDNLGGSETANRLYRRGVKNFEKGNFEKSEYAFKGALRARGSKNLDQLSLHYLTIIAHKQGDMFKAESYASAHNEIVKK